MYYVFGGKKRKERLNLTHKNAQTAHLSTPQYCKCIHILKPVSLTLNQTKTEKNVECFFVAFQKEKEGKRAREREKYHKYNNIIHSNTRNSVLSITENGPRTTTITEKKTTLHSKYLQTNSSLSGNVCVCVCSKSF